MLDSLLILISILSSPAAGTALLVLSIGALGLVVVVLAVTTMVLTTALVLFLERQLNAETPWTA